MEPTGGREGIRGARRFGGSAATPADDCRPQGDFATPVPAFGPCASTTSATRSAHRWPPPGRRCAPSRNGWATATTAPPRSTPTTPPTRARARTTRPRPSAVLAGRPTGAGALEHFPLHNRVRPTRTYDRTVAEGRRYRLMDLFAGCGGMTRGFVDTGRYEPVFAVEMDEHAAATYAANFGDDHVVGRRRSRTSSASRRPTSSSAGRLPGLLTAQPRRRRPRTPCTLARVPARAPRERPAGVRDGERPRAAALRRVRGLQEGRRERARLPRRRAHPQRRRLRRPTAPPARHRDRRPGRRHPLAGRRRTTTRQAASRPAVSPGARSATPSTGSRASRPAGTGTSGATRGPTASSATSTSPRRRQPLPDAGQPRRRRTRPPRAALLAQQADRHHRRLRPPLLEAARVHDPHRVLQAREGPLPPPDRGPADHDPRGRPLHELPGRLRASPPTRSGRRSPSRSATPYRRSRPGDRGYPSPDIWTCTVGPCTLEPPESHTGAHVTRPLEHPGLKCRSEAQHYGHRSRGAEK